MPRETILTVRLDSADWRSLAEACRRIGGDALKAVPLLEGAAVTGELRRCEWSFAKLHRWAVQAKSDSTYRLLVAWSEAMFRKEKK